MKNSIARALTWIGRPASSGKRVALLIPQYNERTHCDIRERLFYYDSMARKYQDWLDLILIDDGSSDGSLTAIQQFIEEEESLLCLAAVFPNARKVGALFATALNISHEWVITSDFDTDLDGLENLDRYLPLMRDPSVMGGYFRMLPFEGYGSIFLFQQLEYTFLRGLYQWHRKDRSARVMPGAGSCYKREILVQLFKDHSGLRNGEDRETTILGIKQGYRTHYLPKVQALTRPPLTYRALLRQRARWNLGYLETFGKERHWYWRQISSLTRTGILTLFDILFVVTLLVSPVLILVMSCFHWILGLSTLAGAVVAGICWPMTGLWGARTEYREIRPQLAKASLLFPFIKLSMEWLAWTRAIILFQQRGRKRMRVASHAAPGVRQRKLAASSIHKNSML